MSAPSLCPCRGREFFLPFAVAVDLDHNLIIVDDRTIRLTPTETELAYVLAEAMPNIVHRDRLIARIWGLGEGSSVDSSLGVMIFTLRRKLAGSPLEIVTVFRKGFFLRRHQS